MRSPDPTERFPLCKRATGFRGPETPGLPSLDGESRTKYTGARYHLERAERARGKAVDFRLASVGTETTLCCPQIGCLNEPLDIPDAGSERDGLTEVRLNIIPMTSPEECPV